MKALILDSFNAPYKLAETDKPIPARGEVLVRILASGVNPLDLKIVAGQAAHAKAKLPAILGLDLAGVVETTGEAVTRFKPGDEVFGLTGGINGVPGSLAQFAAVDANLLALKPKNLSMREAAALPLVFITAWEGLVDRACVREGQSVLIHGGAGGIGHVAVQLAKAKGAVVYSTGKPAQHAIIEHYGAIPIDYTSLSVEQYVEQHTAGEGFDIIFDTVGGATLDNSFKGVKRYSGHVLSALGWGSHALAPLSFRSASYSGVFTLYPLISGEGRAHHGEILAAATALAEDGKLSPLLDSEEYFLGDVQAAYRAQDARTAKGKIVINIQH